MLGRIVAPPWTRSVSADSPEKYFPASKTTFPHRGREKGRGPLSRNAPASPPGVDSGTCLVPGCASDRAAALCGRNLYL